MKNREEKKPIGVIGKVKDREIVTEMKESYLDYAMSVIVARALPDARDGLKPVHRKILYAMLEEGLRHTAKFRKSATVVGSVLGRYHPHGDAAVYETLVRMAQNFSLRYPLILGQGNFGCFAKDTKVKLVDGRSLNFGQLIEESKQNKKNYTFAFNNETKKIEITEIKNPRLTRKKENIIEVTLDNGEKIKSTLDHKFLLKNGSYKEAKNLKKGESLMPAYFNERQIKNGRHYLSILQPFAYQFEFVHKLADEYNSRLNLNVNNSIKHFLLHHKDFNRFNNSPDNIERVSYKQHQKIHIEQVKNLWKERGDEFREKHRNSLIKKFSDPIIKKIISKRSKLLWKKLSYRKKYPENHFSMMAKKLWEDPKIKQLHRKKALKQWQDPNFRKIAIKNGIETTNRRILNGSLSMSELTQKAVISLRKKWQDSCYKEKVIKSKILNYTNALFRKYQKITPEIYNRERYNNCFPRIENALKYFNNDFKELTDKAKRYNHKVVETRILRKREDVYDLTTEPHHNFLLDAGVFVHNSIDGDSAASMRYSEAKLSAIGENTLEDIDRDTVDFMDNYDGTRREPMVLPSPLPNLLLNGSFGIAVGMATSIPTHNLSEVVDALTYLIDEPKADTEDLFKFIQGPDFPTGGMIFGKKDIIEAYSQGKGAIVMRGKAEIIEQDKTGKSQILITEIPYEVCKSTLVEKIAELVQEKRIEGIKDVRDESDKDEMVRIVIELQKNSYPQKVLNRLYKFTDLQKTFYLNMLALVDGIQPKVLSLSDLLNYFIEHRKQVVSRRTQYDLNKAKERAHILEGLQKCLANIDEVIKIIKTSKDREEAKNNLMKRFKLSEIQANAILETKLAALAKLEREKIENELKELEAKIKEYEEILKSPKRIKEIIKKELKDLKEKFGDERRTKLVASQIGEIAEEDLIPQEETVVTLTQGGYIKRTNPSEFKLQKRGGKGIVGMKTLQEDIVEHFLLCNTHDSLLFFTDSGKVFRALAYEIPEGTRVARGRGLLNFLELSNGEKILSILALAKEDGTKDLVMVTQEGVIKRTTLEEFKNVRRSGLIAINLKKGDLLKKVVKSSGDSEVIITTQKGQSIRFKEKEIREMGRTASGVRGISLRKNDKVVGMDVLQAKEAEQFLLVVMANGYGKQTNVKEYRLQGRGGSGIKTVNVTPKTGDLVGAWVVGQEAEDLIVISCKGHVIRTEIKSVAKLSRATQGVRVMRLDEGDKVASATCI